LQGLLGITYVVFSLLGNKYEIWQINNKKCNSCFLKTWYSLINKLKTLISLIVSGYNHCIAENISNWFVTIKLNIENQKLVKKVWYNWLLVNQNQKLVISLVSFTPGRSGSIILPPTGKKYSLKLVNLYTNIEPFSIFETDDLNWLKTLSINLRIV